MIHTVCEMSPVLAEDVFVAPGAHIIGDVEIGAGSSIWFNTVVRGDVNFIRIGERANIQDLTMIHVTHQRHPTVIAHDVTVGHRVLIHGCRIEHHCLVGMGAIVMDGAVIGPYSMIAAGAVVTPQSRIPPGTLALGIPARPKRDLTDEERAHIEYSADHYVRLAKRYRARVGMSEASDESV